MHAGNALGSTTSRQSVPCKPLFKDVVKTLLGLNSPGRGRASAANPRSAGSWNRQSLPGHTAEPSSASLSNGWRPKRASDRLLLPEADSECPSPPQKKRIDLNGFSLTQSISVESVDSLAELRAEEHAGSLSSSLLGERPRRRVELRGEAAEGKSDRRDSAESPLKQQKNSSTLSGSDQSSEDDFLVPSTTRNKPSAGKSPPSDIHRPSSSSSSRTLVPLLRTPDRRRSLNRTVQLATNTNLTDVREKERQRWTEFRERKLSNRSAIIRSQLKKPRQSPAEAIVLSSEEEEGDESEDSGDGTRRTLGSSSQSDESCLEDLEKAQGQQVGKQGISSKAEAVVGKPLLPPQRPVTSPPFLQLEFTSLHAGLTSVDANGKMMITDSSIRIPLKGAEEGEVTVVASQIRGYGVWDGGLAQGGALLAGWEGPAPSLLFLWVTDAQTNLMQRELSDIQASSATSGPPCSFLLLVLKEQLQELQVALLASILDMKEYREGHSSPSSIGLTSPLAWTDGLVLLHSCPPPVDQHLLRLLGQSTEKSSQVRRSQRNKTSTSGSSGLQQLPTRLIQYPAAPSKGRITVTKEDLACLDAGEFLNDVIIDFYLKYLLLEGVGGSVAKRSHVFSSFFYKQLSRRRAAGEDNTPSVPDRHMRHQRVKTWTRHVDIFTKDFLFVPVNQEAHWYLVVVCFPGLDEVQREDFWSRTGGAERAAGPRAFSLRSQQPPECTKQGCQRETVLKRPCILVMDSLKLSYHENVCRLLRDYLQVEWEVRRATPRLFTPDSMRSSSCRVPQQDNSSDCGLYLLQYVESFLQNPVVQFDLPVCLDNWFSRQQVRQKREEIRSLVLRLHKSQQHDGEN